jgi:hypothetical protein
MNFRDWLDFKRDRKPPNEKSSPTAAGQVDRDNKPGNKGSI